MQHTSRYEAGGPTAATRRRPASPCTKVCQIDESTNRCQGCHRTLDEIARWGGMSTQEREDVWQRLERIARPAP